MKVFTVKEVAEIMKMNEQTVRNKISEGQIKSVKFFGATRITKEELERITGLKYEEE